MSGSPLFVTLTVVALAWQGPGLTRTASAQEPPDRLFEKLLAVAMKDSERANWKELRRAFARTPRYHPYRIDVDEKLKEIARSIGRGELKESETALLDLVERGRYMRIDSLAMLMMLYDRMEQPEKSKKYRKFIDGILGVLEYPKSGASLENPIEVLFVQEEYLVTTNMPIKGRGSSLKNGHFYDIFTLKAKDGGAERQVFFNTDLLRNAGPNAAGTK